MSENLQAGQNQPQINQPEVKPKSPSLIMLENLYERVGENNNWLQILHNSVAANTDAYQTLERMLDNVNERQDALIERNQTINNSFDEFNGALTNVVQTLYSETDKRRQFINSIPKKWM